MSNKLQLLQLVAGLVITSTCMMAMATPMRTGPLTPPHPSSEQATRSAAPASPQTALARAKAESQHADARNKIVCKRLEITGSRMGRKVCHTQTEWTAMEDGADIFLRDMQSRGGMRPLQLDGQGRTQGITPEAGSAFDSP